MPDHRSRIVSVGALLALSLGACSDEPRHEVMIERQLALVQGSAWIRGSGVDVATSTTTFPQALTLHVAIVDDASAPDPLRYPIRSVGFDSSGAGPVELGGIPTECPNTDFDGPAYGCATQFRVVDVGVGMLIVTVTSAYDATRYTDCFYYGLVASDSNVDQVQTEEETKKKLCEAEVR